MKFKWIIPFIIFILLLVSWFNRWEQVPAETYKDKENIYMRDRWTGKTWFSPDSTKTVFILGGEMEPLIPQKFVRQRQSEIMEGPEYLQRKEEYETIISENTKIKTERERGYIEFKKSAAQKKDFLILLFCLKPRLIKFLMTSGLILQQVRKLIKPKKKSRTNRHKQD